MWRYDIVIMTDEEDVKREEDRSKIIVEGVGVREVERIASKCGRLGGIIAYQLICGMR